MYKIINIFLMSLIICSVDFSQSQNKTYSESISYSPRAINTNSTKTKNNKNQKSNKSRETKNALPNEIDKNKFIHIPVSVFDSRNMFVEGLQSDNFKVFINEQEQNISTFSNEIRPLNLILILDTSPSTAYKIEDIKNFALNLVSRLQPQDKVQLINFNGKVRVSTELTNDRQIINKAISKLKIDDGTALYDAVKLIFHEQIKTIDADKTVVLLTDAVDTTSLRANYQSALEEAEKNDAVIFPFFLDTSEVNSKLVDIVTFTPNQPLRTSKQPSITKAQYDIGRQFLIDLAALSGGTAIEVKKLENLKPEEIHSISTLLKPRYLITVELNTIKNLPFRSEIRVRINRPNLIIKSRGSFIIEDNN